MEKIRRIWEKLEPYWRKLRPYALYVLYGVAIVAALLIFIAVKPKDPTPTEPPEVTEAETVPETTGPVYSTDWYPQWERLSYEQYKQLEQPQTEDNWKNWTVDGKKYVLNFRQDKGLYITQGGPTVWVVPNSRALADYGMMGTNGQVAAMKGESKLVIIDLLTGDVVLSLEGGKVLQAQFRDRYAVYVAAQTGTAVDIYRCFLGNGPEEYLLDKLYEDIPGEYLWMEAYRELTGQLVPWLAEDWEKLPYADYVSREHSDGTQTDPLRWKTEVQGTQQQFEMTIDAGGISICNNAGRTVWTVPDSQWAAQWLCCGCNGRYAFLYNDTQVVQVALLTGEKTVLYQGDAVLIAELVDRDALGLVIREEGMEKVYRLYLPDGKAYPMEGENWVQALRQALPGFAQWLTEPLEYVGYEQYFSQTRYYEQVTGGYPYLPDGYTIMMKRADAQYPKDGLYIRQDTADGWKIVWYVPESEKLVDRFFRGEWENDSPYICDGRWFYTILDRKEIVQVDLLTGKVQTIFTADRIIDGTGNWFGENPWKLCDRVVLYFTAMVDDRVGIYRMYLPDMRLDTLMQVPSDGTIDSWFYLHSTTNSRMTYWQMINPEIMPYVRQVLADADHPIMKELIQEEVREDLLADVELAGRLSAYELVQRVQEEYHIPALVWYSFDGQTGEYTRNTRPMVYADISESATIAPDTLIDGDVSGFQADRLVYADPELSWWRPMEWRDKQGQQYSIWIMAPHIFPFSQDAMDAQAEIRALLEPVCQEMRQCCWDETALSCRLDYEARREGDTLTLKMTVTALDGESTVYTYVFDLVTGERIN